MRCKRLAGYAVMAGLTILLFSTWNPFGVTGDIKGEEDLFQEDSIDTSDLFRGGSHERSSAETECLLRAQKTIDWAEIRKDADGIVYSNIELEPNMRKKPICERFNVDADRKRSAWTNIFAADEEAVSGDGKVTLVSQFTLDRFNRMKTMAINWKGPMSVSLLLKYKQLKNFTSAFCKDDHLNARNNIQIHISLKQGEFYPMNFLRNLALHNAKTSYIFLSDIDLIPVSTIEQSVAGYLKNGSLLRNQALVVPCFEKTPESEMPKDKKHLIQLWDQKKLEPCQYSFKWTKKVKGQQATNYSLWRQITGTYNIEWEPEYEPYIILHRDDTPDYYPKFVGRNRDKLAHLLELHYKGIEFVGSADIYTVHMPHRNEKYHQEIIHSPDYGLCSFEKFLEFLHLLEEKYDVKVAEMEETKKKVARMRQKSKKKWL